MDLVPKIAEYHKVTFETAEAAQKASNALMGFVGRDISTMQTMVGANRVVLWDENVGPDSRVLYVSPGGLAILQRLTPLPPAIEKVRPADLPKGRALLLGDARDWDA